jgi:hypothetical protein
LGLQGQKARLQDESIVEDQFDEFLSRLELLESEDYNGMDDEDLDSPVKERVLLIRLEKTVFEPLLSSIKMSRPALYQAVVQQSIIAGQQKSNRNKSKREKKRDRRLERDKEKVLQAKVVLAGRMSRSQRKDKGSGDIGPIGTLADLRESPDRGVSSRETLAVVVAKALVEGTMSTYLITIALLLQTLRDEKASSNLSNSSRISAIPIGNVLAAIFERPDGDYESDASDAAGASSTQNSTGSNRESKYLPNPFHAYLLSPRDEPAKSVAYSDMSRGDMGSVDDTRTEDTTSQAGGGEGSVGYPGPHSDAGSTIGSTR